MKEEKKEEEKTPEAIDTEKESEQSSNVKPQKKSESSQTPPQTKPQVPLPSKKTKRRILRDRELSFKTFLISHLGILILGLIFLGSLYYILYFDRSPLNLKNYDPVTREPISFDLEISNPEDNSLVFDPNIIISGKTDPKSTVLISNNQKDTGVEADQDGSFTKVITLTPGVNYLSISAFERKGSIKTKKLTVFYSEVSLEEEEE